MVSIFINLIVTKLPPEVSWSFLQYKDSFGIGWVKFWGGSSNIYYYFKEYNEGSSEWKKVMVIFHYFLLIKSVL